MLRGDPATLDWLKSVELNSLIQIIIINTNHLNGLYLCGTYIVLLMIRMDYDPWEQTGEWPPNHLLLDTQTDFVDSLLVTLHLSSVALCLHLFMLHVFLVALFLFFGCLAPLFHFICFWFCSFFKSFFISLPFLWILTTYMTFKQETHIAQRHRPRRLQTSWALRPVPGSPLQWSISDYDPTVPFTSAELNFALSSLYAADGLQRAQINRLPTSTEQ